MISVAIVGAGYWGSKHVRVFHELPDAELAIVCDSDPARLEAVRHSYPRTKTTTSFDDVLESDVEAVVIATSVDSHFELGRRALSAGKHVLIEKPLTTRFDTAEVLVRIAEEAQLVLMTGHTYQYHPAVEYLKEFLASGELGDLYYVDSARLNLGVFRHDVDVLWDLAPHDLSMLLHVLGTHPTWVSAEGTAHVNPSIHEVSYLTLSFPGQVLAHIHVSWLDPCKVRRLTLVGSRRMVVFDDCAPDDQLRIYDKGATLSQNGNGNGNGAVGPGVQYHQGEVRVPFIPPNEPLKLECADFLECVATGRKPKSNGREALRVVSILEAAHRSPANGGAQVPLRAPEPDPVPDVEVPVATLLVASSA